MHRPPGLAAGITTNVVSATAGAESGYIRFSTTDGGSLLERIRIQANGNLSLATTTDLGQRLNLNGRAFLTNKTAPGTPTGGGIIFVDAGALKYIGSSGTITTLAVA